jgi:hypothetical protein
MSGVKRFFTLEMNIVGGHALQIWWCKFEERESGVGGSAFGLDALGGGLAAGLKILVVSILRASQFWDEQREQRHKPSNCHDLVHESLQP